MKIRIMGSFLSLLILANFSYAQSYWEIGAKFGAANYSGDLTPSDINTTLRQSHAVIGAQIRYNITERISAGIAFNYATISGDDSKNPSENFKRRNLDFESQIQELNLNTEINLFKFNINEGEQIFTPYAKIGFGVFHFDPVTYYNGRWVKLQPLGTEGQGTSEFPDREKYSLIQFVIPFGGGLKFMLTDNFAITAELAWRFTFTDYLDDVSTTYPTYSILASENGQLAADLSYRGDEYLGTDNYPNPRAVRGGPEVNDYYFFGTLGIRYALQGGRGNSPFRNISRRSRVKCPKF